MDRPRLPPLPKIDAMDLKDPIRPELLVTFLNRALKRRGFIFGVNAIEDGYRFTIYEAEPWQEASSKDE